MYKELDINNWNRKNHFYFFKDYDNPFYNICTNIEITELLKVTKENKLSFFLSSLFLSIKSANTVEEFRYRIKDDKVIIFDVIHPFSTVLNDENNFSFCPFNYFDKFDQFEKHGKISIKQTIANKDKLEGDPERLDVIHYTTIPWISLTSVSHARKFNTSDSIPKIVFGKYFKEFEKIMLPICIEVHHSLVDGYHVAKYLNVFRENIINSKSILIETNT